MRKTLTWPVALTVAGSDSGGGAGIQADLKTFRALEAHGVCAITALTAQNPGGVTRVEPSSVRMLRDQLAAIAEFKPAAAKTGMLFSSRLIDVTAEFFAAVRVPLIVDPVMIATSGAALLQPQAVRTLKRKLLPLATAVTPNTAEVEALCEMQVREPEDLRQAARMLHEQYGCATLIKGGHLDTGDVSLDVFYDGREELLLEAPRARGRSTHGTGCIYSAAIAAWMARGERLPAAVVKAKEFITRAIHESLSAGPFNVLNT